MTNRDTLGEQADFYRDLHDTYIKEIRGARAHWVQEGVMKERRRIIRFFWLKVTACGFIGMSLALALAIWLSTL